MNPRVLFLIVFALAHVGTFAAPSGAKDTDAAVLQASEAMDGGRPEVAREILLRALADSTGNPYLLYNIALTHYAQNDFAKAGEILLDLEGLTLDPSLRGRVLAQLGNLEVNAARSVSADAPGTTVDHLRRAQQLFASALSVDSSQSIASANEPPTRNKFVQLILTNASQQIDVARKSKTLDDRIQKLISVQRDLDEAIALQPNDATANALHITLSDALFSALTELGDHHLGIAEDLLEAGKNERGLEDALTNAQTATNAYRDGLLIRPDSPQLAEQLEKGDALSARILVALGIGKLVDAEKLSTEGDSTKPPSKKEAKILESALQKFDQAVEINPDDESARQYQDQTRKASGSPLRRGCRSAGRPSRRTRGSCDRGS